MPPNCNSSNNSKDKFPTIYMSYSSPLGPMILATTLNKLIGVWFKGQRYAPTLSNWLMKDEDPLLQETARQLTTYFSKKLFIFNLPLYYNQGTFFQVSVWQSLAEIPYGETRTYSAISENLGNPNAARAVGTAIGHNPFSIIVPCHRVLGRNGTLNGYAGGLERKSYLLDLENS